MEGRMIYPPGFFSWGVLFRDTGIPLFKTSMIRNHLRTYIKAYTET